MLSILLAGAVVNFANLASSPAAAASPSTPTMEPSQVVEYNLSATGTKSSNPGPLSIIAAGNGSFWVAEFSGGAIAQFFPSNGTFHQFPVPSNDSLPAYITVDRRGMVWFSDQGGTGTIWMFNPSTKSFTPHPTFCQDSVPVGVLVDAQNNVWFAEDSCSRLGELTYPNYVQEEYPLPLAGSGPAELAKGGDAIWITESIGNRIAMFNTTTRAFKEFTPSVPFGSPVGIVLDSQGIVWISEHGGSSIVRFDPSKDTFTKYPTSPPPPAYGYANSAPATLVMDNEGRLWFVEHFSNKVGRLDPLSGRIDEFTIPSSGVYSIESAVDAEGNFWFTEFAANKLGELSASAAVPLEVKPIQPASISLQAGGLTQAEFMVTNEMSSSATISLNVTATLSVTGSTSPSEATLDATSLTLKAGETAPIIAYMSPPASTSAGYYSLGVSASIGNESTVESVTFLVVPNSIDVFLNQTLPDLLVFVIIGLMIGNFVLWGEVKKIERMNKRALVAMLIIFSLLPLALLAIPSVSAKCPGLPGLGQSSGGPSYVTYIVLALEVVVTAILAYFVVLGFVRVRRANRTINKSPQDEERE